MSIGKVSDLRSVDVVAPAGGVVAGVFYRISGWNGFATVTAAAGVTFALQISDDEMFEINVGALAFVKGAVLYITPGGAGIADLTATAAGNIPAIKAVEAKDVNNIAWVKVLNIA